MIFQNDHLFLKTKVVDFRHMVSRRIGINELEALDTAVRCMIQVLEHGARDKSYDGKFIEQGYEVQIEHAIDHLKNRGKPDPQSGLDELTHSLMRIALAVALSQSHEPKRLENG